MVASVDSTIAFDEPDEEGWIVARVLGRSARADSGGGSREAHGSDSRRYADLASHVRIADGDRPVDVDMILML
jgi:hypothetical protein